MHLTDIFFNERVGNVDQQEQASTAKTKMRLGSISVRSLSMSFIAFMIGRVSLVGGISPFGAAFFAATYGQNISPYAIGASIMLGIISWSFSAALALKFFATMSLFVILTVFAKWCKVKGEAVNIIKVFTSAFLANVISLFTNFLWYYFILAFFESIVTVMLYILLRKGTAILLADEVKKFLSSEEVISLGFIGALTIAGIRDLHIFGAQIVSIVCIFIVFLFARSKGAGAGAATGVTMGLVSGLTGVANFSIIGSYAFSGFLSGLFRKLGKVGSILGFITGNALLTYYLNGSTEVLIQLRDIIVAAVLLYIIPLKYTARATRVFSDRTMSIDEVQPNTIINPATATVEKLNAFSKAVEELATSFNNVPSPQQTQDEVEVSNFFDTVAERVCKECSLCLYCWDRKFHSTYKAMFSLLEVLERKGKVVSADIPVCFSDDSCARAEELISTINSLYEVYRVNQMWKKKVEESRSLVSQQLEGVSRMISKLANEVESETSTKRNLELKIMHKLEACGFSINEISVNNENDDMDICIVLNSCAGLNRCKNEMGQIVSEVLGKRITPRGYVCNHDNPAGKCKITFTTGEVYKVTVGVSRMSKENNLVSGDSFTFMELKDRKYILGLSDGMGSGKSAARNSQIAVDLLEKFLESGFDKDIAVKIINSVLVLKSADESYATMDISAIDLYSGNVEFVKIGSPPSYIKKNGKVEIVKGASLPVGILENIDLDLCHKKVSDGDFIIMVTDGAMDSNFESGEAGDWIADFIEEAQTSNPQELADWITYKAATNYGEEINDDVTVLVAKIWERV